MMSEQFDMVVIGGGPGGYVAAIRASQLGAKVALIEKERLGGTCLNWGCIPTKAMIKTASLYKEINEANQYGIKVDSVSVDYEQVLNRKDEIIKSLGTGIEKLLEKNKVTVYQGVGRVTSVGKVTVTDGQGISEELSCNKIILATGSSAMVPPIEGVELPGVIDSNTIFNMRSIPDSLVVIGGGVVGLEFASIYSTFGSKVTVVEMMDQVLPGIDPEIPKRMRPILKKNGIDILTKTKVTKIEESDTGIQVLLEGKKGEQTVGCDKVLVAAGRKPNFHGIEAEKLGLAVERGAIVVNEYLETNVSSIYAIGDVTGGAMLAHVASAQGIIAAENAVKGNESEFNNRAIPSCIFTNPEIATVGLDENNAKEQGYEINVSKFPFTASGKALAMGKAVGTVKLISDKDTGRILGGHIMGPHASDLIAEVALAIENNITAEQIAETIHAHPTLAETIMEAAHGLVGKPIHLA